MHTNLLLSGRLEAWSAAALPWEIELPIEEPETVSVINSKNRGPHVRLQLVTVITDKQTNRGVACFL